jgi:hypothetical protein
MWKKNTEVVRQKEINLNITECLVYDLKISLKSQKFKV